MNINQQITVRGVDETTKQRLVARAQQLGISLNAYNLELLRRDVGTSKTKKTNGLERFAGTVSFIPQVEDALRDQRRTNTDKWDSYGL